MNEKIKDVTPGEIIEIHAVRREIYEIARMMEKGPKREFCTPDNEKTIQEVHNRAAVLAKTIRYTLPEAFRLTEEKLELLETSQSLPQIFTLLTEQSTHIMNQLTDQHQNTAWKELRGQLQEARAKGEYHVIS